MSKNIIYDKPFKTYDEMLNILQERNIIIKDRESAKELLSDISYYRLINGYKHIFTSTNDKFDYPILFEELYTIYIIDNKLNNIIFSYILEIERALKSKISYVISENYGVFTDLNDLNNENPNDYLCKINYANCKMKNSTLKKIKEIMNESRNTSVHHYIENHNHIPCWIITNTIPLGTMIKWFQILKSSDKDSVCSMIIHNESLSQNDYKVFMTHALEILRTYRNNIAHGNRSYTSAIKTKLPKNIVLTISNGSITKSDYTNNGYGNNDLFAVIIIVATLTRTNSRKIFLNEIINYFDSIKDLKICNKPYFDILSLPSNFIDRLKKLY